MKLIGTAVEEVVVTRVDKVTLEFTIDELVLIWHRLNMSDRIFENNYNMHKPVSKPIPPPTMLSSMKVWRELTAVFEELALEKGQ